MELSFGAQAKGAEPGLGPLEEKSKATQNSRLSPFSLRPSLLLTVHPNLYLEAVLWIWYLLLCKYT